MSLSDLRTLGRTGVQVSPYALGTMNFGPRGNNSHEDSIAIIHRAFDPDRVLFMPEGTLDVWSDDYVDLVALD